MYIAILRSSFNCKCEDTSVPTNTSHVQTYTHARYRRIHTWIIRRWFRCVVDAHQKNIYVYININSIHLLRCHFTSHDRAVNRSAYVCRQGRRLYTRDFCGILCWTWIATRLFIIIYCLHADMCVCICIISVVAAAAAVPSMRICIRSVCLGFIILIMQRQICWLITALYCLQSIRRPSIPSESDMIDVWSLRSFPQQWLCGRGNSALTWTTTLPDGQLDSKCDDCQQFANNQGHEGIFQLQHRQFLFISRAFIQMWFAGNSRWQIRPILYKSWFNNHRYNGIEAVPQLTALWEYNL